MPTGLAVLAVACVLSAAAMWLAHRASGVHQRRYPDVESVLPGEQYAGPLPEQAVELWAAHDPSGLGFAPLGILCAGPYWREGALVKMWVDESSGTVLASVTFFQGGEPLRPGWRRSFATYHGDAAQPNVMAVRPASSAALLRDVLPGCQQLYWPAPTQAELLEVHLRQRLAADREPLVVASLDEARRLMGRSARLQQQWLLSSGVVRRHDDGRLGPSLRTTAVSVWRGLPTLNRAVLRADRAARSTVAGWPAAEPGSES